MRKRRMMRRIKPLLAALLAAAVLLAVRGCAVAFAPAKATEEAEPEAMLLQLRGENGELRAIELEEYLVGVVAAEMPAAFHLEALKAQAVAARTYALYRIEGKGCAHGGDVCTDSSCCQAYTDPALLPQDKQQKIRDAVYATAGQVLRYEGELIDALFHSTAGGMTEDSENVFASAVPYLRSVVSNETDAPRYQGQKSFILSEAEALLGAPADQWEVLSRYPSGRVEAFRAGSHIYSGREVRRLLGLDSAHFTFELTADAAVFHTKGCGHGVGMSQTGANAMAEQGADHRAILTYYYTGVEITPYV